MPVMDEFKEERAEIKKKSFPERCSYFWYYYKWHVIGGAILLAAAVSLIHTSLTRKDTAFYAAMINMSPTTLSEDYKTDFARLAGIDLDQYNVYFDTDMHLDLETMDESTVSTTQKLMVYVAAGDMDIMISDLSGMNRYAYNRVMVDLREFLSPEEFEKFEPYFYYMDNSLVQETNNSNTEISYPEDPADPTGMTDPVPVGICLDGCSGLNSTYYYNGSRYFCVFANCSHTDLAHTFLNYIWDVPEESNTPQ